MRKNDVNVGDVVDVTVDGGVDTGFVVKKDVCFAKVNLFDDELDAEVVVNVPYKNIQFEAVVADAVAE